MSDKIVSNAEAVQSDAILKVSDQSVQTFFYTAIRNHVDLGEMADKKAHTLMGVNLLLLSVLVMGLLENWQQLTSDVSIMAVAILGISIIVTISLSILATRPIMSKPSYTTKDLKDGKVNLAFFGNFKDMQIEDFEWAVGEMKKEKEKVSMVLTTDLYFLGKTLDKKYNRINLAYNIFMVGIGVTVVLVLFEPSLWG